MSLTSRQIYYFGREQASGLPLSMPNQPALHTRYSAFDTRYKRNASTHRPDEVAASRTDQRFGVNGQRTSPRGTKPADVCDDLANVLIGLNSCILVSIQRQQARGTGPDPLLLDASTLAALAVATVRRLGTDQSAADLAEVGFWGALENAISEFTACTSRNVAFFLDARLRHFDFPTERALLLLHVAREALANAERSPLASTVAIRLFLAGADLVLTVTDQRVAGAPVQSLDGHRFRFVSFSKRARDLGGTISLGLTTGGATIVQLSVRFPRTRQRTVFKPPPSARTPTAVRRSALRLRYET